MPSRPDIAFTSAEVTRLKEVIRAVTGIEIPDLRNRDLQRALVTGLSSGGYMSLRQLEEDLLHPLHSRRALEPMLPALTVGETHFFRNQEQIQALRDHILPGLIQRHHDRGELRIWSAGCSTGEEPYTIAILLDRLLGGSHNWQIGILGTDINPSAIARATEGIYGSWSFREVPPDIQNQYFTQKDGKFHLSSEIKSRVNFMPLNLIDDAYPSEELGVTSFDLVLCRNVLIYFRPELIRTVVERMARCLADEGWLMVGPVEPFHDAFGEFESVYFSGSVVYRKRSVELAAPNQPRHHRSKQLDLRPAIRRRSPSFRRRPHTVAPHRSPAKEQAPQRFKRRSAPTPADVPLLSIKEQAKEKADRGDFESAERLLEEAVAQAPLSVGLHLIHGLVLTERGAHNEGAEAFRRALFLDSTNPLAHYSLAVCSAQLGRESRAIKALQTARSLVDCQDHESPVPEGDGLTYGRLSELIEARLSLLV